MEATEQMLVAGLKETEPLGELVNWREGFGREEMQKAFAAMMAAAWQPMDTAPKDGTIVLFAGEFDHPDDWRMKMGYWAAYDNDWHLFGGSWQPTHWMPLPTPPSNAGAQATAQK